MSQQFPEWKLSVGVKCQTLREISLPEGKISNNQYFLRQLTPYMVRLTNVLVDFSRTPTMGQTNVLVDFFRNTY